MSYDVNLSITTQR